MGGVFISYSHDSAEHKQRVRALADKLRAEGLPSIIDQDMLPAGPPEGWAMWSEAQVRSADHRVLVACTATYCQRYESDQERDTGLGAVCEARAIRQLIYNAGGVTRKFRVVLFSDSDNQHVPLQLQGYHRFLLYQPDGYQGLVAWLRDKPTAAPAPAEKMAWPEPASEYVWQPADRKEVFAAFQKMLTGQAARILLLAGVSSMGKTIVLTELRAYAAHLGIASALLDFKGCPSLDEVFQAMRLDLGREILSSAHDASGPARFYNLISDLQRLSKPLLLMFDSYEQASLEAQKWIESQLLPRLDRAPGVIVLLGGQQVPPGDKRASWPSAEQFQLQPIQEPAEWVEYKDRKYQCPEVTFAQVEVLTDVTNGNPGQLSALLEALVRKKTQMRSSGHGH
jgi:hypothetical protein